MTIAATVLKAAGLILISLAAFWATATVGGFEPPNAAEQNCAALQARACLFALF